MSNLNDETKLTTAEVANGNQSNTVAVNSSDNADNVTCFIRGASGGDPGAITVIAERYSELEDEWMELGRNALTSTGAGRSVTDEAVPSKMRYSVVNDSGGAQEYTINVVSH